MEINDSEQKSAKVYFAKWNLDIILPKFSPAKVSLNAVRATSYTIHDINPVPLLYDLQSVTCSWK